MSLGRSAIGGWARTNVAPTATLERMNRRIVTNCVLAAWAVVSGCNGAGTGDDEAAGPGGKGDDLDDESGGSIYAVGNRLKPYAGDDGFLDQVQPTLARQCVTCHSCGDAPCQLKLTSFDGVVRGSNEENLYAPRVLSIDEAYDPAHLDHGRVRDQKSGLVDYAASEDRWRSFDFYSVIAHGTDSVMARVLTEAQERTTSLDQSLKVAESLDDRDFTCVGSDSPGEKTMVGRAMPLGLPALEDADGEGILAWFEDGARGPSDEAQAEISTPTNPAAVAQWEDFFNPKGAELRDQLIARYVYEHVFFANLHLDKSPGEFYRLVRSRTRTGPIDQIVTELPNEDPGSGPVFYRLMKQTDVLAAKQHIAWSIGSKTMQRWQQLLYDGDWKLTLHDGFDADSDNPFEYFAAIPAAVRYRFMLENSREMIDAMVRGSVCSGNGATFAIRDRFWIWFLEPDADPSALEEVAGQVTNGPLLGESSWFHLDPAEGDTLREIDYLRAYRRLLQQHLPDGLSMGDLWDGNGGTEPDAWLTVTRHGTSASVETGPRQGLPETIWVLNYSNFERLYYNLVVNFETWGNVAHKLETWELMSLVRSEAEDLFLTMLPPDVREEIRGHQTRGWGQVNSLLLPTYAECSSELEDIIPDCSTYGTAVEYASENDKAEGDQRLSAYLVDISQQQRESIGGAVLAVDALNGVGQAEIPQKMASRGDVDAAFDHITGWSSSAWEHLPEITLVRVRAKDASWLYTILGNRIYTSHDRVYFEGLTRVPEEDTLSVSRGVVGARPQLFIDVELGAVPQLVKAIAELRDHASWVRFVTDHRKSGGPFQVIDRRDPEVWTFLDDVHKQWFAEDPVNAAVLDISEYLWPQRL